MKTKTLLSIVLFTIALLSLATSCSDIEILSPPGPQGPEGKSAYTVWVDGVTNGEITWTSGTDLPNYFKFLKGEQGEAGKSAYDLWKEYIQDGKVEDPHNSGQMWDKNKNTKADFYHFLTGAKGNDGITPSINNKGNWQIGTTDTGIPAKGQDGANGSVVTIGSNGNWFIDNVDTNIPAKGKDGEDGKDGTLVTIGLNGNWFIDGVDSNIPAKGKDGTSGSIVTIGPNDNWFIDGVDTNIPARGQNGTDGSSVTIGTNGNWFIDGVDTGIPAKGKDGTNGTVVTIGTNGNWFIDGVDSGVPAKGQNGTNGTNGSIVTIGTNGNWFIDGVDSGIPAKGQNGTNGTNGSVVTIGSNGNWFIDNIDTNIPAEGKDGTSGKSAYEIWKEEVAAGTITDKDGNPWPTTDITLQDFWKYLSGKDGNDATEKQRTTLSFVSSTLDGDHETFVFKTDAGAIVTMNYRDITISATADGSGICSIDFPCSTTEELPVVVYAEAANKKESYPISVKVRIYTKIYITYDYDGVKWHNKNGDVLDNSTETHGKYTPGTVPYYSFKNAMNGNYITIPFEATDIKEIRFSQSGGFSQLNITTGLDIPNDYSKGVIKIMHTGGVWMQGTVEVTLTAETIDGTIITHKINVEPEM